MSSVLNQRKKRENPKAPPLCGPLLLAAEYLAESGAGTGGDEKDEYCYCHDFTPFRR
jgi:hypothetical protein